MEKIKTILVPYDFSEPSEQGLSYAINFAGKRPGTHLRICFIADQESEEKFKNTFESIKEGLSKAFRAKLSCSQCFFLQMFDVNRFVLICFSLLLRTLPNNSHGL